MSHVEADQIAVEPIISFPRRARPGTSYLMTIDLRHAAFDAPWSHQDEEYVVYCVLETSPLFRFEAMGEPAVVLHRFGGTYGPAVFLLTAEPVEAEGSIRVTLVNGWGMPVQSIDLEGIRWYLERYSYWPSGVFQQRAKQIEAKLPEWGQSLFTTLNVNLAREAFAAWNAVSPDVTRRFTSWSTPRWSRAARPSSKKPPTRPPRCCCRCPGS
jgi:hypothetical protein